jgi:flagellar protein FlaG
MSDGEALFGKVHGVSASGAVAPVTKRSPVSSQKNSVSQPAVTKEEAGPASLPKTPWQVSSKVQELIQKLAGENTRVSIGVDEKNRIVLTIVDSKTGDVIRRIPPEELTDLMSNLPELKGSSLDAMA